MERKKELVFRFLDTIYSGYKKELLEVDGIDHFGFKYVHKNGRVAFDFIFSLEELRFQYNDFFMVVNMFGISIPDMSDICKEYAANKFDYPLILSSKFFPRHLRETDF
jgi:hypothetical protein